MTTRPLHALACLLASTAAAAQAPTLLQALRSADVVVTARVVAASDPSPEWHRLHFAVTSVIAGAPGPTLTILEPAGACCGRSLFALQVGDERLLFLSRVGATLHPRGGAHGVLLPTPALLAHVAALRDADDPVRLAQVLSQALDSDEPAVVDDAAATLAGLPAAVLGRVDRAAVGRAFAQALAAERPRQAHLADVAVRLADEALLDSVLDAYVRAPAPGHARLLRQALQRGDPGAIAARIQGHARGDDQVLRAVELLLELPPAAAWPTLASLLPRAHPRVALRAAEGLLGQGVRAQDLVQVVPGPVLELAERQRRHGPPFRAIDPARR
jgi:hypothetical protein